MSRTPAAQVFASEWPRLVAALVRDLGDLGLAEDCAQDAFVEAARRWGPGSTPDRPGAWLLTTARRKAIDQLRRDRRFTERMPRLVAALDEPPTEPEALGDEQLALVFGCCHPSLSTEAQIALTLRHVGGLSTAQIARAFLVPEATMAKRLVRAKHKIRDAGIPFTVPGPDRLTERLDAVLGVIYLVFTEGHTSTGSTSLIRGDLCDEARFLAGLVADLLPSEPEVLGLAALVHFNDARRDARLDATGALVLMEDQDRRRWDRAMIERGNEALERAIELGRPGPYQLQAAIAANHVNASSAEETDWAMVAALYGRLWELQPSAVIGLNGAVAMSMVHGPAEGLRIIDELAVDGALDEYRYLHAARADLLRRLGRADEAAFAYRRALALSTNDAERSFLAGRLADLTV